MEEARVRAELAELRSLLTQIAAGDSRAWQMLGRAWLRGVLRAAVDMARTTAVVEAALEACWTVVAGAGCRDGVARIVSRPGVVIDGDRLHRNLGGLIASAGAAAAAQQASGPVIADPAAPARVGQWLLRASGALGGTWETGASVPIGAADWRSPEASRWLVDAAWAELPAAGRHDTTRLWADYWLGLDAVPEMRVPLAAIEDGAGGQLWELRLARTHGSTLVEHYDVALQPVDTVCLQTLHAAQTAAGGG